MALESLDQRHSDAAIAADYAALRAQLGEAPAKRSDVIIVPDPNPKTVSPGDLERSPSVRLVGRLRMG